MSLPKAKEDDELCRCPCHLEGLECHSCYAVMCPVLRLEAELKRLVNPS